MASSGESDAVIANPLRAGGLVKAAGLEQARAYTREHGGLLSDALLRLELVREGDFLRTFAELYSTRFVKSDTLRTLKLDEALLERVGPRLAERLRMCPIRWDEKSSELHVVAAIPISSNLDAELRSQLGARGLTIFVATAGAVSALVRRWYYREDDVFESVTANGAGPEFPAARSAGSGLEAALEPTQEKTNIGPMLEEPPPPVPQEPESKTIIARLDDIVTVDTLRKENARYRIAQEFHRRVSLERSMEAMVESILAVMFELLAADGAAIWLTSGQYAWKLKEKDQGTKLEVPRSVIDQVLVSIGGLVSNDALVDERFGGSESVMVRGIKSVMAVPLRTKNGTLGILYVESVSMSSAFTKEDLPLLEAIGSQAAILLDNSALMGRVKKELENRANLSRFLSPAAVEEVLSGRAALKMEGQLVEVTVLFADIRNFTNMSSLMPPEEVVRFLNRYFTEMVDAVEKHHGIVDKYIGDAVMAVWGALSTREDDARNAVAAAQEMVERARKIRVNGEPLNVGVGVHTGLAVVGAIGSRQRLDFTAIGATVNLSSRLCGIAGVGEVLMTSDTLMRAGGGIITEAGEAVILKGLEVPIVPYSLKSIVSLPADQPLSRANSLQTQPGLPTRSKRPR